MNYDDDTVIELFEAIIFCLMRLKGINTQGNRVIYYTLHVILNLEIFLIVNNKNLLN